MTATPHDADLTEFEVKAADRKDPREGLAAKLIAKGWSLRRLEQRKVNLDAVFNEVVRSRAATAPAPVAVEPPPAARTDPHTGGVTDLASGGRQPPDPRIAIGCS